MNNLVTGASGFIGSFIAESLIKRGEKVRGFVRKTSDIAFLKSIGAEIFQGSLDDCDSVFEAMKGVEKVFHSGATVGDWVEWGEARRVNVKGTKYILEAAVKERVKRFVFISSLGVLGMKDHNKTPDDAPRIRVDDAYIYTKVESEELVENFTKKNNLPFTVIRPGYVFGPRDKKVIPRIVDFLKKERYIFVGSGLNKINMIYVENLADFVVKASYSEKAVNQIYNITNDSNMTMMDLVYMVADLWGCKRPAKHIPKNVAYILCNILESFAKITRAKNPPLLNKTRLKFLTLNLDFDISKARTDLGYTPQLNMLEGLRRTKAWMEKTGL